VEEENPEVVEEVVGGLKIFLPQLHQLQSLAKGKDRHQWILQRQRCAGKLQNSSRCQLRNLRKALGVYAPVVVKIKAVHHLPMKLQLPFRTLINGLADEEQNLTMRK
jgi:hypothetical protein